LAREALACNNPCNKHATARPETVQQMGNETGAKVAQLQAEVTGRGGREGLGADAARALLAMSVDDAERRAGRVPAGDTAAILCRSCGPVWVHPSIAGVLPVVNGWARALGCPWCFIAKDGRMAIPRPFVTCAHCQHFRPDKINPEGGCGTCAAEMRQVGGGYPAAQRHCMAFLPKGPNS
jgi:hypothetical protein